MHNATPQKYYIGIAAGFHDGAIALVNENGEIVFAESTERFTQNKRSFTSAADNYFFAQKLTRLYSFNDYEISINWKSYDNILKHTFKAFVNYFFRNNVRFTKWFAKKLRRQNPNEYAGSLDMNFTLQLSSLFMAGTSIRNILISKSGLKFKKIHYFDHHLTHAYYSFYTSAFKSATLLVIDGNGESQSSISIYNAKETNIDLLFRNKNNCSLGDYYGRITQLCGFDYHAGEQWKVMGLAPYGKINEWFLNLLKEWIGVNDTGIFYKDKNIFFKLKTQIDAKTITISVKDIAYTGQYFYESILSELVTNIYKKYPNQNLIITGGCGLNSAANGKIHTCTPFKNVYISSAPADDGCSIGAALLNFKKHNPTRPIPNFQSNSYLGVDIPEIEIQHFLKYAGYKFEKLSYENIYLNVANHIHDGEIVAWVQGRAEFGPRALGNRSILANPCLAYMKDKINLEVKFREEFRPFAPSILENEAGDFFEDYYPTPYMERVLKIKKEKQHLIPSVTHVDGTGRLQTVSRETNEHFYNLISAFKTLSNVPVLLNTSLNIMGKPIVNSVSDIAGVFATSGINVLVINNYVIYKS